VIIHLIDGTYELFRHFYGLRRFTKDKDRPFGAVVGVLNTVLQMVEEDATHVGVATDHVIESFRNELWNGYKTGEGIEPALLAQFHPLEEALAAMGIAVWPMVELEADDALASAAAAQLELRKQTGGFNLLCQRGPARRPSLPTPRPNPLGDRSPRHPSGASELQPRRHRELQPSRRSSTPPRRHHGGCPTLASLTAMSRHRPQARPSPRCTRAHTRQ